MPPNARSGPGQAGAAPRITDNRSPARRSRFLEALTHSWRGKAARAQVAIASPRGKSFPKKK